MSGAGALYAWTSTGWVDVTQGLYQWVAGSPGGWVPVGRVNPSTRFAAGVSFSRGTAALTWGFAVTSTAIGVSTGTAAIAARLPTTATGSAPTSGTATLAPALLAVTAVSVTTTAGIATFGAAPITASAIVTTPSSAVFSAAGPYYGHGYTGGYVASVTVERAISVSGAEFTPTDVTAATMAFSNVNVGPYNSDYKYEGVGTTISAANRITFDYLYARGIRTVKIPIRWERIQRTLGAALDTTEVARLTKELDMAQLAGHKVVIDLHNYGLYYLDGSQTTPVQTTNTGYRFPIGSTTVTQAHFADVWSRLATAFASHPAVVGFHIMNEPQGTGGLTRATWYACAQAAVTAIRAVSSTVVCRVGGWQWSDCYNWTVNNPSGTWITDPASKTWYEAHQYFSELENGDYTTYANAVAHAQAQGHVAGTNPDALHTKVLYDLGQFAAWCTTYGVKGVIGETSVPGNTAVTGDQALWNTLFNAYLARCDTLRMNVNYWSTGELYGTSTDPLLFYYAASGSSNGVNTQRASAPTLEAHLTTVF